MLFIFSQHTLVLCKLLCIICLNSEDTLVAMVIEETRRQTWVHKMYLILDIKQKSMLSPVCKLSDNDGAMIGRWKKPNHLGSVTRGLSLQYLNQYYIIMETISRRRGISLTNSNIACPIICQIELESPQIRFKKSTWRVPFPCFWLW